MISKLGHEGGQRWRLGRENPATKRASKSPTIKELYWAAGLLDGEGNFNIDHTQGCVVQCEMTDAEPIEKLFEFFGGHFRKAIRLTKSGKPVYAWRVYGSRARGVMMTLYPLLCPRRQEKIRYALHGK